MNPATRAVLRGSGIAVPPREIVNDQLARLFDTSDGSMSTQTPRAPRSRAAAITMRPSPQPRSKRMSSGPTSATSSIRVTTSAAEGR